MNLTLQSDNQTLLNKFNQLKTIEDVCSLLEIDRKTLIYLLYRKNISSNYKIYSIKKRSGGIRQISAPISSLKIIQQKLSYILNLRYVIRPSVHGFCCNKSIVTNANVHSGKTCLLNLDLKNFFPSINFGRVRGLFISGPFSFPPKIATIIAQICVLNNELPQGAPTSPVISNLICSRLDGQLQELAKRNNLLYTRYADDITFSTWQKNFSNNLLKVVDGIPVIGKDLEKIIILNGFAINEKKVRVASYFNRQEITGLVSNKFPNVKRSYIRELRVILHNWDKYGIDTARDEYYSNNRKNNNSPYKKTCDFKFVILGKINFVKMVKGHINSVYRKLINKYNLLDKNNFPILEIEESKIIENNIWIIEVNGKSMGTGFLLENYGLVTCNHVLDLGGKFTACKSTNLQVKYELTLLKQNSIPDIAILSFTRKEIELNSSHLRKTDTPVKVRDLLLGVGFPLNYSDKEAFFYETKVVAFSDIMFTPRLVLDKPFTAGMSGSPLLNSKNEVVGIISTGSKDLGHASDIIGYTAIPIAYINNI
jgi:RNA-directed DNA polymerase